MICYYVSVCGRHVKEEDAFLFVVDGDDGKYVSTIIQNRNIFV